MARPLSRLFHAVVVVGASLTGCNRPAPAASATPQPAAVTPEPAEAAEPAPPPEPATPVTLPADAEDPLPDAIADAGSPTTDRPERAAMRPEAAPNPRERACPLGSDSPFPPCYHIL